MRLSMNKQRHIHKTIWISILVILIGGFTSLDTYSQTEGSDIFFAIQHSSPKEGKVKIHQDARLHRLVDKHIAQNRMDMTIPGYRIQIYSGSDKREEAFHVKAQFMKQFPKYTPDLIYSEPYFKLRVGNFRTKQEGYKLFKLIKKHFPNSYFVIENKMEWPEVEKD